MHYKLLKQKLTITRNLDAFAPLSRPLFKKHALIITSSNQMQRCEHNKKIPPPKVIRDITTHTRVFRINLFI